METEREHLAQIDKYYTATHRYYERFWQGESLGLHYGFWMNKVRNRKEAIIKENEVLADMAGIRRNQLILDAGCGIGGSALWLARERGAKVIGINIVERQLAAAKELALKEKLYGEINLTDTDYHWLPYKNGTFDAVWSLESIEHAYNVEMFIREAFRVLKPGGRVMIAGTFRARELSKEEGRQMGIGLVTARAFVDPKPSDEVSIIMRKIGFSDIKNLEVTDWVMESSREMKEMCRWGVPAAKIGAALRITPPLLVTNNQWGIYQEALFKSGAISYNILLAQKP